MKEVLIIYFTQTGQLHDILKNVESTLGGENINIDYHRIVPEPAYDFPWKNEEFYDVFPESYLQIPQETNQPSEKILSKKYDLIILGYQVWFLTPSRPISSFLKSDTAKKLFKDTPVVTLVACRNMWIQAQEKIKIHLKSLNAHLVGHIALVDRHINHISVITIQHWMINGKKDRLFGIFPKPGVSDTEIAKANRFGAPIREALLSDSFNDLQDKLLQLDAVRVNPYLVRTDERGNVLFSKWANFLIKKGGQGNPNRLKWIGLFKYYLLFAIWVIAPIVFIVFLLTYLPMTPKRKRERIYYSSVALNEN
ncbi:dialkylrecorsinol condensing enzyme DarA [Euzebyella marina]|uniref:Dialkylrecorsinol condensing enzyme DarA n=1 Tax=Euzebyella marina TaxID=1761453 RepID=A0A3G2LAM6_9FLAO|nr:dialkylrecorsinol condensing enzyme DarA [Euzebyella marina]AYN69322.1 dialkylrecorsinol condensing enzyme DarA [Euzebyella marina]